MDTLFDLGLSAWAMLAAGIVIGWRLRKRDWLASFAWVALLYLAYRVLRTLRATLKMARTPDQRAYVVLAWYAAVVEQAADYVSRPTTSKREVRFIRETDKFLKPLVDNYVAANRSATGQAASG